MSKLSDLLNKKGKNTSATEELEEKSKKKKFPDVDIQSIIPVKQIYRGMIITSDDRYVKILEVFPINFSLRSDEEQANIIHLFASWLRVAPVKLQFKVITKKADTFNIINNIRAQTENEQQEMCRELAENYIDFIQNLGGNEALSRRFFLIFEYEQTGTRRRSIDEIAVEMKETARKIRAGLAACGNEVVTSYATDESSVPSEEGEDYFQAEALYQFYNRRSCAYEQFVDRTLRVAQDIMRVKGLDEDADDYPDIPACDFIAPRGMDLTNPDYIIIDGLYQKILMVKKDGYPTTVYAGWISTLIESGDGIDVDIILRKESKSYMRDKVSLNLKLTRIKASDRSDVDKDYEEIEDAIGSASFIKNALANGEDFYHMYTFITVSAETKEELLRRTDDVFDYLYSNDIEAKEIKYRLEDAFQVVTPLLIYKPELMEFAARNIMTGGACSVYPFTSCELCDENGVVLGINRRYQSIVNLDVFNAKKYKNANISIVGSSGSGKTYTELTMALRMRIQGIQTFIISPDKAHEFRRACGHIDGSFIRISPGSQSCINVMEIRPTVNPTAELIDGYNEFDDESWLFQKANQLRTFFKLLVDDLTNEEEQLVDEAVIKTYNMFNITEDNNSIYNADGSLKPMPILGDLYQTISQNDDLHRVGNILRSFVTGSAQSFNQQTNVDLQNKFIVFDLSDLSDKLKAVGMFIVMDFLWSKIKENRTEKKALFIDEGWQLIGASTDTKAADFVYRIFKIIRGYGGSAVFATQDISDLFAFQDGKYGKAIISNSRIKIVLGLEPSEAKAVKDVLQLTKYEVRNIINFNRGEGLICVNNNKLPVLIKASELEDELITTDPTQLREILNREQAKKKTEAASMQRSLFQKALKFEEAKDDIEEEDVASKPSDNNQSKPHNISNAHVSDDIDIPPVPTVEQPQSDKKSRPMSEEERVRFYEQEARMSLQAMEQMETTDIAKDSQGKIIPNDENDGAVVPIEKSNSVFSEDESELFESAKPVRSQDNQGANGNETPQDYDPNLNTEPAPKEATNTIESLSSFHMKGDDF